MKDLTPSAIGRLLRQTGAVYLHQLGQPLLDIRITLEELERKLGSEYPNGLELIAHIRQQIDRISSSSDRFCDALGEIVDNDSAKDISAAIEDALSPIDIERLRREEKIAITFVRTDDARVVYASALLREHIYNLVNNSLYSVREALAKRLIQNGKIAIQTQRVEISNQFDIPTGNPLIEVRIADNGTGVPEESVGKIGVFGYTTKASHGGTGYGLAAAQDYVSSLGGNLRIENHPGEGFVVAFSLQEYDENKHAQSIRS